MSQSFFQSLISRATQSPDEPFFAFHDGDGRHDALTFADMLRRIAAASSLIRARGAGDGDTVLIFAQHGAGMLLSFFGAQWHGAIPAFMPPPTVKQDVGAWVASHRALIERIRPALILAEPDCMSHVTALADVPVISTDEIAQAPAIDDLAPACAFDADRIAFLQHSSGTTGLKKGVTVTYRQLISQLENYSAALALDPAEAAIVSWLPLYHDMGLIAATLMPFHLGVPVKIIDTFAWLSNPGLLIGLLAQTPDAYCWLPNFAFSFLAKRTRLELGPEALSGVRAVINCSEPCKAEDMDAFVRRFAAHGLTPAAVKVCYAMAEYVFAVTQTPVASRPTAIALDADAFEDGRVKPASDASGRAKTVVSVGRLIDQAEVRIEAARSDEVGEILVRGPSLCSGYFRNPALTEQRFAGGWYHTGDLGFVRDGELYVTGRKDDLIIVRGKNIYAHDLEEIVTRTEGAKAGRSVAFGVDNAGAGTQDLVLLIETDAPERAKALQHDVYNRIIDGFGVAPADIVIVAPNSLTKTTSGKISRSDNLKLYLEGALAVAEPVG